MASLSEKLSQLFYDFYLKRLTITSMACLLHRVCLRDYRTKHEATGAHPATQPTDILWNTNISKLKLATQELQLLVCVCVRLCIHEHHFGVSPYKTRHHSACGKSPSKQLSPIAVSLATSSVRMWLLEQQFVKKHKELSNWVKHKGNYI